MGSAERFDSITRLFGSNLSRRQAIKLAIGGAVGTVGVVALQQRSADAACIAGTNCFAPNFCCPNTVFGDGTCAPPTFPTCCGTTSCAAPPSQQCCPGTDPLNPAIQVTPPFCAPGTPATHICCGTVVCVAIASTCASSGCCVPAAFPAGTTCCGPTFCVPGTVCVEYPPGTFNCNPVPSDRNIKEHVVPVAW